MMRNFAKILLFITKVLPLNFHPIFHVDVPVRYELFFLYYTCISSCMMRIFAKVLLFITKLLS
jgi:hypothetical protein